MEPFQQNKPLADLSTFGIGGNARLFTSVKTIIELQETLRYCHEKGIPFHLLGKGSNSLFDDRGFDGLVIQNKIGFCEIEADRVHVGAGFSFSHLGVKTARQGLSGLEFASGIPATVGGAIFMNAGANGFETADYLTQVTFVHENGEIETFSKDALTFSYRSSSFQKLRGAIAAAQFVLEIKEGARERQLEIVDYRKKTQPLTEMTCGCVFRNPNGESAGALIEKCGLKNMEIGDAKVSPLHANFIINKKSASAEDVLKLAQYVSKSVKEQMGIELEMELRTIPYRYE